MDASGFDRLAKSLSGVENRRAAAGRLAAMLAAAVGLAIPAPDDAAAGLRHRRRVRNRHEHDNRKGKRKNSQNNPPRGAGGLVLRCGRLTDGTPCRNIGETSQIRCCKGVCPEDPTCVPPGEYAGSRFCATNDDCVDYGGACCSGVIFCDTTFENRCLCVSPTTGEPCAADNQCSSRECVCGRCV